MSYYPPGAQHNACKKEYANVRWNISGHHCCIQRESLYINIASFLF